MLQWYRCPWQNLIQKFSGLYLVVAICIQILLCPWSSICSLCILIEINSSSHLAPAFRVVNQLSSLPLHWHAKVSILGSWSLGQSLVENLFLLIDWVLLLSPPLTWGCGGLCSDPNNGILLYCLGKKEIEGMDTGNMRRVTQVTSSNKWKKLFGSW